MRANPTLTVSLPEDLLTAVRAKATTDGRPLSWTVADLLRVGLKPQALRGVKGKVGRGHARGRSGRVQA